MRHQIAGYKLGRNKGQRIALKRTLIRQFFTEEKIKTTRAKALFIRADAEKLITLARNSGKATDIEKVNARRLAASRLGNDPITVKKLFDDLGPRFANRNGGYTRLFRLGLRLGDAAEMVQLELVEE
jgi:large subunit ribosomal protein L17